jgi:DNA-binding CsgD family transcriptional regulator
MPYFRHDGRQILLLVHGAVLNRGTHGNHTVGLSFADITMRKRKEDHSDKSNLLLTAYCACLEYELIEKIKEIETTREEIAKHISNQEKAHNMGKTMICRMREYKKDLNSRIQQNLSMAVYPLIGHLREAEMPASGLHLLDVLEFSIKHITSRLGIRLLTTEAKLSAREIQICHMIRAGKDSREIAASLGVTYETVIVDRKNIRKKLGLNSKRQKLADYMRENA